MRAALKKFLTATPLLRPVFLVLRQLNRWYFAVKGLVFKIKAHVVTLIFIGRVVMPVFFRTRCRPVVFLRHMALGDVISTFPAALELKKRHPNTAFFYFCLPAFACLPRMGGVTNLVAWPPHVELIETTYAFLFTAIYKFVYHDEEGRSTSTESVIAEYCRQHGVTVTETHSQLAIAPALVAKVRSLLEKHGVRSDAPLILIHPGPSWNVREWPGESWSQLTRELVARNYQQIIQLGSGKRGEVGTALDYKISNVLSLVNQLTLEEAIALISLGDIFIGIDSGLLHVAVSVGVPAIGIFGPTTPQLRFSVASASSFVISEVDCQGCHHRVPRLHWQVNCPFEIKCMKSISATQVLDRCLALLASRTASGKGVAASARG